MPNCSSEEADIIISKYLDREFNKIQQWDFPSGREKPITDKECINSFKSLIINDLNWKARCPILNKFHKNVIHCNRQGYISPYEFWKSVQSDKDKFRDFYKNRLMYSDWFKEKNGDNMKYLYEGFVPEFIYSIGISTGLFAPLIAMAKPALFKKLIKQYLSQYDTIFDPTTGYSSRMIATLCLGKNFIGRDINDINIKEISDVYEFLKPYLPNKNSVVDLKVRDAFCVSESYDCLLTCPPYGNKEVYKNSKKEIINTDLTTGEFCIELMKHYDCKDYVFVVDKNIGNLKDYIVENLTNTSHIGSNTELVIHLNKFQRDFIINNYKT